MVPFVDVEATLSQGNYVNSARTEGAEALCRLAYSAGIAR